MNFHLGGGGGGGDRLRQWRVFLRLGAGLSEVKVSSREEAMLLLQLGLRHRHMASTRLNYQSSRSHTIFTIKMMKTASGSERPHNAFINR